MTVAGIIAMTSACYSAAVSETFYLTTPIYYINSVPHLGHAYTTIVADAMARYHRLAGDGRAASYRHRRARRQDRPGGRRSAGVSPQALADRNSRGRSVGLAARWARQGRFHPHDRGAPRRVVQAILQKLWDTGEIYLGKYGGHYCFGCERFYTEKEIVDGKCPDHQTPLT